MAVTQYYKVSVGWLVHALTGGSNVAVTSGGCPTDSKYDSVRIDNTTNPPTLIIGITSASGAAPTGFGAPVTANGRVDQSENWGHK